MDLIVTKNNICVLTSHVFALQNFRKCYKILENILVVSNMFLHCKNMLLTESFYLIFFEI